METATNAESREGGVALSWAACIQSVEFVFKLQSNCVRDRGSGRKLHPPRDSYATTVISCHKPFDNSFSPIPPEVGSSCWRSRSHIFLYIQSSSLGRLNYILLKSAMRSPTLPPRGANLCKVLNWLQMGTIGLRAGRIKQVRY